MGYVRHSKNVELREHTGACTGGPAKVQPHRTSDFYEMGLANDTVASSVWRQAQQLRAAWRRERYALLRGN